MSPLYHFSSVQIAQRLLGSALHYIVLCIHVETSETHFWCNKFPLAWNFSPIVAGLDVFQSIHACSMPLPCGLHHPCTLQHNSLLLSSQSFLHLPKFVQLVWKKTFLFVIKADYRIIWPYKKLPAALGLLFRLSLLTTFTVVKHCLLHFERLLLCCPFHQQKTSIL